MSYLGVGLSLFLCWNLLYIVEMSYFGLGIYYILWNDILVLQCPVLMLSCCWNVIVLLKIVWNDILC